MADSWVDPYLAFNFKIIVGEKPIAHFTECSGLSIEVETVPYREGGDLQLVHQVPMFTTYHDITLRYGLTDSTDMWDWFSVIRSGRVDRRNVSIVLLDSTGQGSGVRTWNLLNAFPKRWSGALLRASAREVAVEEMTLAYESLGEPSQPRA